MVLGTVAFRSTTEIVFLDRTCEAFALAGTDNVYNFTFSEDIGSQSLAHCIGRNFVHSNFAQILYRSNACLFELAFNRLGQMFSLTSP